MPPETSKALREYRRLYTWGLRAVQYSQPARFVVRDTLRHFFRKNAAASFDQEKIDNTVEFLRGAAHERGLEHQIVKNLVRIWNKENSYRRSKHATDPTALNEPHWYQVARTAYEPFHHSVRMLNESMNMCLPDQPKLFDASFQQQYQYIR
ncbi:uncharacterized protein J3D65DRAFT_551955 [Phyllosticta citribraziliensis]|uniref:DUF1763-domain-containing protein n=1 Tax=Phyllosticta citribraziliensis TaxID=989973 RepID=A0ABR1LT74_9PEZI